MKRQIVIQIVFGTILLFKVSVPAIIAGIIQVLGGSASLRPVAYVDQPIEFTLWLIFALVIGLYCFYSAIRSYISNKGSGKVK